MSTVTSTGELLLEAMPDAPDAEWLRTFLEDYNRFKRQSVAAFAALDLNNTKSKRKSVNLMHGTETEVASPLADGVSLVSVVALQVEGVSLDSLGKPNGSIYALGLAVPLAWRPSGTAGKALVTAKYDTTPTAGVTARVNLLFVGE